METLHASNALVVPDWPAPAGVRAFVTTRRLPGNSQPPFDAFNLGLRSGESEDVVRANRDLLVRALALPAQPFWLRQVHGAKVVGFDRPLPASGHLVRATSLWRALRAASAANIGNPADVSPPAGEGNPSDAIAEGSVERLIEPEADAAVTRMPDTVLVILTADCLPILLCDEDGSEIGAVHAGWRGLAAGVIEACVGQLHTPPAKLMAWLGPAIGPASYEVGDEVRAAFVAHSNGASEAFAATRPGHWHCDLYTLARQRLRALGVTQIYGGAFDTLADPRFYSYRRDGAQSGRFATLIYRPSVSFGE